MAVGRAWDRVRGPCALKVCSIQEKHFDSNNQVDKAYAKNHKSHMR